MNKDQSRLDREAAIAWDKLSQSNDIRSFYAGIAHARTGQAAEVAELVEALEYYGFGLVPSALNSGQLEITTETGKRARQALASYGRGSEN